MDDAKQEKTLPSPFPVPQEVLDAFERVENYVRIGEAMAMMEASSTSDQVKTEEEKKEEEKKQEQEDSPTSPPVVLTNMDAVRGMKWFYHKMCFYKKH